MKAEISGVRAIAGSGDVRTVALALAASVLIHGLVALRLLFVPDAAV
ncbi:MAG: hypothetical protein WDN49_17650 [Acetobacteraceae bacterium]